jgi:hypothetical protein
MLILSLARCSSALITTAATARAKGRGMLILSLARCSSALITTAAVAWEGRGGAHSLIGSLKVFAL